jgi:hypothetical protein
VLFQTEYRFCELGITKPDFMYEERQGMQKSCCETSVAGVLGLNPVFRFIQA